MFSGSFEENKTKIKKALRADESFDIIERNLLIGGKNAAVYYINGLANDEVMEKILEFFLSEGVAGDMVSAERFALTSVPYVEITTVYSPDEVALYTLSGMPCLIADGWSGALAFDTRKYPQRVTAEPEDDKVLRGSKDGFVETVILNLALIRRRIRDPRFSTVAMRVGDVSKSDVVVCYMDDRVDKTLLDNICERIRSIRIDALKMNQQSLIEALYRKKWLNPLPKVKYTERPDVAAAVCMKGNIVILVDNAPSALLIPTSIFDLLEEADDYYFPPVTGTYIRISRYLITVMSVFLTPVWLLMLQNPEFVPQSLSFLLVTEHLNIPVFWQLMILEVGIDGLRLASLHTPSSLTSALSIIGAIAFSQFGIDTGWFSTASVLYVAMVTIANYSQPNYELTYSLKFIRFILMALTYALNIKGFIIGVVIITVMLIRNKTLSGKSFLFPLSPLNLKTLVRKLIRIR